LKTGQEFRRSVQRVLKRSEKMNRIVDMERKVE
jgi:hypothetical protein